MNTPNPNEIPWGHLVAICCGCVAILGGVLYLLDESVFKTARWHRKMRQMKRAADRRRAAHESPFTLINTPK